jgi:hypothetical protein
MTKLIILCFSLMSFTASADVLRSSIHSIEKIDNNYLVKFKNGRVGFLPLKDQALVSNLKGLHIEARLDKKFNLLSMNSMPHKTEHTLIEEALETNEPPEYAPTVIPNLNEATKIFNRLNPNYRRASECSNRAHIWASEEFKNSGLKSMKVFVLFTASYINRVRFKWWFHVAPMVSINENGTIQKRIFDFMFNHRPVTVREWTNQFVFSGRPCLPTKRFSEYDVNPQTEDCYLMEESMYYWTPVDLHKQELEGRYKTEFSQGELKSAYSEAF